MVVMPSQVCNEIPIPVRVGVIRAKIGPCGYMWVSIEGVYGIYATNLYNIQPPTSVGCKYESMKMPTWYVSVLCMPLCSNVSTVTAFASVAFLLYRVKCSGRWIYMNTHVLNGILYRIIVKIICIWYIYIYLSFTHTKTIIQLPH